ncbi:MAG TPA: CHAT domain-containing protein [Vicinamibacteria bacterium]|nr:CHAT domain-containing protein [Vicinamibacteria bacterium]
MTAAFAGCYLAAATGEHPAVDSDGAFAESSAIALALGSASLSAEVDLRRGACLIYRKDYTTAESVLRGTLGTVRAHGLRRLEAHVLGSFGWIRLRNARFDDATEWLGQSLAVSAVLGSRTIDLKLLGNLGWCYTTLGDIDKALPLLEQAERLARERGYIEDLELALAHQGEAYRQGGDLPRAIQAFERALAAGRGLANRDVAREILANLESLALEQGDYAGAERYAQQAPSLGLQDTALPPLIAAEIQTQRGDLASAQRLIEAAIRAPATEVEQRWKAHAQLAQLHRLAGRPAEAEKQFVAAEAAVEKLRQELVQDTFDFLLYASLTRFYDQRVAFLLERGRGQEALQTADRARGRVLWGKLGGPSTRSPPRSSEKAAAALDASLVFYRLAPEVSTAWITTAHGTRWVTLAGAKRVCPLVERHQAFVLQGKDLLARETGPSQELFDLLLAPLGKEVGPGKRVVIVPDGCLSELAFESLVVPTPRPHYWIEDAVVARSPSLALLGTAASTGSGPAKKLLLLGDPVQAAPEFPTLAGAQREMAQVEAQFAPAHRDVYAREKAHPDAYRTAEPGRFSLIHFAAHATANRDRPLESAVVLSRPQASASYKLYARDIAAIPLQAKLVTLSACRGAGARSYAGEGLVGLAWAFLHAGAQNVVAGLWNVEDASTALLMEHLYREIGRGSAPMDALRSAKLALLGSPTAYRKPFYWAPFVVYLQAQAPSPKPPR